MWIVSQDGKIILEAVKFERFEHTIEVIGRGGNCFRAEYNNEKEARSAMSCLYTNLRLRENVYALPRKEEENA